MDCTAFGIPAASPGSNIYGLGRSKSSKDLRTHATIRRSCSDNHLVCCVNHRPCATARLKNSQSMGIFPFQFSTLRSFLFDQEETMRVVAEKESGEDDSEEEIKKRANWVERLLEVRSRWRNRLQRDGDHVDESVEEVIGDCEGCCEVSYSEEEEEEDDGEDEKTWDHESFSRFLVGVEWSDIKLFSQLAFLCNLAYVIPDIKSKDLKSHFGLNLVTSSLERKAEAAKMKAQADRESNSVHITDSQQHVMSNSGHDDLNPKRAMRATVAYGIAASAASYVQSGCEDGEESGGSPPRVAAYVAASTMTAVVAAGEREKSEAAKDLQSLHSAPCEWFVCDDPSTYTRCFVIQGSDSLASWQANLFFEPTKFEQTDCLVHRGIYEAGKGMYEQFKPEIMEHLDKYGERAKLQFTGHSLGGSLSLIVHLMLLSRKAVKPSVLRPVVTFGSPFVFCGGHKMLQELAMDETQIHCVMMHRDIVPRAFSCNYPNHVANVLKRLNAKFRSHPCLNQNKLLYTPMGKLFILQPDENSSPRHPLLPQGCSLYAMDKAKNGFTSSVLTTFLNSPHPLETLSDPMAYGSDGTILRDHDSSNYLKAINGVLKLQKNSYNNYAATTMTKERNNGLWPLLTSPSPHSWSHDSNMSKTNRLKEIMTGV